MPFRFRLEKILTYRQRLIDAKALELADAGRRVAEIGERVAKLEAEIARCQESAPGGRRELSVFERVNLVAWIEHLRAQRSQTVSALYEAQELELARRTEMIAAWQDLEVLKKLKEKRHEEWQAEMRRLESRALDEIGVQRADRARREKVASV